MKFYLGSQTSDCTVTLVFGKMVILDIWRNCLPPNGAKYGISKKRNT